MEQALALNDVIFASNSHLLPLTGFELEAPIPLAIVKLHLHDGISPQKSSSLPL